MVERRIELDRLYRRKKKLKKWKAKLATATGDERERILYKIHRLSPWWREPTAAPAPQAKPAAAKKKAKSS